MKTIGTHGKTKTEVETKMLDFFTEFNPIAQAETDTPPVRVTSVAGNDLRVLQIIRGKFADWDISIEEDVPAIEAAIKNGEVAPFEAQTISFSISCPTEYVDNFFSRAAHTTIYRYDSDKTEFPRWLSATTLPLSPMAVAEANAIYQDVLNHCAKAGAKLVEHGVHESQVQYLLPSAPITKFFWCGTILDMLKINMRILEEFDAVPEVKTIASTICGYIEYYYPLSVGAYTKSLDTKSES